ncbi:sensor histidine kinase [Microbacterium sp. M1A1_1b]|uniref:sensor histidine kinase n=1 Tax=Curtobacterium sp. VKM Ac-2922 TaxID=2929475 RepID=UPI001FB3E12D|nr:histidine kinase [Curtobacterium sp. VKM Ac-2922]MCJ1715603.1 histidine kinase [Curtobacterium sp. VKM Ac-2922]
MASADARTDTAVRRRDVVVATLTAIVGVGLLLSLPAIDAADPDGASLGVPALGRDQGTGGWWLLLVVLLAQSAALVPVRRMPGSVLVATAVLALLPAAVSGPLYGLSALPVGVAVVLLVLTVPPLSRWAALGGAAVLVAAGVTVNSSTAYGAPVVAGVGQGLLQAVGVIALPLLATLVVRSRREVTTARRDEQRALVAEHQAMVDATLSRERAAMARELHDIAAHHLSGIALMAGVVDRQIDTEPDKAHAGVRQVRAQSTAVLDDLRRLVGLLRDDTTAERSVETFATIPALVDRAPVEAAYSVLTDHPEAPVGAGVGPLAQLAAYRTVQEALTNAATHATGALCTVQVDDRSPDRVTIVVHNDAPTRASTGHPAVPPTSSGGFGLVGMRERADLVGADLSYGPASDGGWDVRLVLPRDGSTP